MKARVGDQLWPDGDENRAGLINGAPDEDGEPPYVVRWSDGHVALVSPGPHTRIMPGKPARPGRPHYQDRHRRKISAERPRPRLSATKTSPVGG